MLPILAKIARYGFARAGFGMSKTRKRRKHYWLSRRYSSSDCCLGIFLFAQGELARWFKSSSSESSVRSSGVRQAGELGLGFSLEDFPLCNLSFCNLSFCNLSLGDFSLSESIVFSSIRQLRAHHNTRTTTDIINNQRAENSYKTFTLEIVRERKQKHERISSNF